jgi:glycosyltransferase involved in cell wall biosynthesis
MTVRSLLRLLASVSSPSVAATSTEPYAESWEGSIGSAVETDVDATESLDVCLLSYRSDPYCGGQGVYVRHLSDALSALGHDVTVISGKPYPELPEGADLVRLPGKNIVDELDRVQQFERAYLRDPLALLEWVSAVTGGFPDPYTFGRRVVSHFEQHRPDYDVVHDNQSLCYGLTDLQNMGYPVVATVHHPITVDREADLEHIENLRARLKLRRWYGFLRMQQQIAPALDRVLTVSEAARRRTISDFGVAPDDIAVVHNGIDTERFEPRPTETDGEAFRVMTTVSADVSIKGARYLLAAFATLREEVEAELHVVGEFREDGNCDELVTSLGIRDDIYTHSEISYDRMVDLYGAADVAVVPSVFEGFGLPAGEAMACGVPVVATTGGALPEVVGDAGVLVEPEDASAIAEALLALADDPDRRRRLGQRGRDRIVAAFDWERAAGRTADVYRAAINEG